MSYGTKKSGFTVSSSIISTNTGAYSLWLKADMLSNGDYIFSPLPATDGPMLIGVSGSEIKVVAGDEQSPVTMSLTWAVAQGLIV